MPPGGFCGNLTSVQKPPLRCVFLRRRLLFENSVNTCGGNAEVSSSRDGCEGQPVKTVSFRADMTHSAWRARGMHGMFMIKGINEDRKTLVQ